MTAITLDDRAQTIEIEDSDGAANSYTVALAAPGLSMWAVTLTRLDSGESYRVCVERGDYWRCTCKSWKYRKKASDACKHCHSLKLLYRFLTALTPAPKEMVNV